MVGQAEQGAGRYLELLVRLHRDTESTTERDALLGEALELVESLRARTLMSSMRAADDRHLLSPEGKEAWDRLRVLKSKMASTVTTTLEALPAEEDARSSALEKLEAARAGLDEEITSLERELKASEPKLAAILPIRGEIDAASLAGILGEREVLLHFNLIGAKQLVVFTADERGALDLHTVELDDGLRDAVRSDAQRVEFTGEQRRADAAPGAQEKSPGARSKTLRRYRATS